MQQQTQQPKADQLFAWMRQARRFASHDVIIWGAENAYNRADRTKRIFVERGLIRKLSEDEKTRAGYHKKDDLYEVVTAGASILEDLCNAADDDHETGKKEKVA